MSNQSFDDDVGESSCYAHVICPSCQIVLDGSPHRVDCTYEVLDVVDVDHGLNAPPRDDK